MTSVLGPFTLSVVCTTPDAMPSGTRDPRDGPGAGPGGRLVRDIYIPLCRARHNGSYAEPIP